MTCVVVSPSLHDLCAGGGVVLSEKSLVCEKAGITLGFLGGELGDGVAARRVVVSCRKTYLPLSNEPRGFALQTRQSRPIKELSIYHGQSLAG